MTPPASWPRRAAMAAVALAACVAAATQIRAYDLWWHLKAGEWILLHHDVPRADPFSFTSEGVPWVDHGWLWQVFAWALHALGGPAALVALKMACAAVVAAAAMSALRRTGWGIHVASMLVILCLAAVRFRFADRPDTASLALLAVFLHILTVPDSRTLRRFVLAGLTCVVWAGVHASVLLAPVLALAYGLGSLIAGLRGGRAGAPNAARMRVEAAESLVLAVVCAAGAMFNPYGVRLLGVPFRLGEALSDPRLVNPEWLPPSAGAFPVFHLCLSGALLLCAAAILKWGRPHVWRSLLLVAAGGFLAMSGVRHLGVFFTLLPFAAAAAGAPRWPTPRDDPPQAPSPRRTRFPLPAAWAPAWGIAAAVAFPLAPSPLSAPPGFGVEEGRFPAAETDYVASRLNAPRRLYNDVAHGGYLIWRFFPEDTVFADGRNEVHAALLAKLGAALDDGLAWSRLLDGYGIRAALVRYREERIHVAGTEEGEARSFAALHFPSRAWALVHWGDTAMVFVRRGKGHDDLIASDEYHFVHPEDWQHQLRRCESGDEDLRTGILQDLHRRLSEAPSCRRARELLTRFEGVRGP